MAVAERRVWVIEARPITQTDLDNAAANNASEIEQRAGANPDGHLEIEQYETDLLKNTVTKNTVLTSQPVIGGSIAGIDLLHAYLDLDQDVEFKISGIEKVGQDLWLVVKNSSGSTHTITFSDGFDDDIADINVPTDKAGAVWFKGFNNKFYKMLQVVGNL